MLKKIKTSINKLLREIAKENEKTYGTGRMDCCDLNRTNKGERSGK